MTNPVLTVKMSRAHPILFPVLGLESSNCYICSVYIHDLFSNFLKLHGVTEKREVHFTLPP